MLQTDEVLRIIRECSTQVFGPYLHDRQGDFYLFVCNFFFFGVFLFIQMSDIETSVQIFGGDLLITVSVITIFGSDLLVTASVIAMLAVIY